MDAHRPCPDAALLAAFIDGALPEYERTAVVSHLVECDECRAVAMTVVEFREVEAFDASWEREAPLPPPAPLMAGGVTRWSREKTRAPALAIAAVAAIVAIAIPVYFAIQGFTPSWSAQQAVSTLIDAAEEQRPLEARLSGAVVYAAPPSDVRGHRPDERARLQLINTASTIRTAYERDYGAPSRRAIGVAALLTGDLDEAIGTLEIAASAAPQDTQIANDLAAAYYERAVRANRPDDLPAALSAVERVLYQEPGRLEALFNRGLIVGALGLRAEAHAAWQAYIDRDPDSPWTAEARQRLESLAIAVPRSEWPSVRDAFDRRPDDAQALLLVKEHTSASYDFIENVLLNRWLAAVHRHDAHDTEAAWLRIRVLAGAFARQVPDNLYQDFVVSVDRARTRGPEAYAKAVAAHEMFAAGMRRMSAGDYQAATRDFVRAAAALAAASSPFALRARIELATMDYYGLRYSSAMNSLGEPKTIAQANGYLMLVTRGAWVEGLAAYGSRDFRRARIAYEQMLATSAVTGHVDQWLWACGLLANLHDTLDESAVAWRYRIDAARRSVEAFNLGTRSVLLASSAGDAATGGHHAAALLIQSMVLSSPVPASLEVQVRAQRARSLTALQRVSDAEREVTYAAERLRSIGDEDLRSRINADLLLAEAEVFTTRDPQRAIAAAESAMSLPITQRDPLRQARFHLVLTDAAVADEQWTRAERAASAGIEAFEQYRRTASDELSIRRSDAVWRLYSRATQVAVHQGDVTRAFQINERGRARTALERSTWGMTPVTLSAVQQTLDADTAIAVMMQLDHRLQVWLVRRSGVKSHSIAMDATRASGLVAAHLQEMALRTQSPGVSGQLYDAIFGPLSEDLAAIQNLVLVADSPYNRIAFAGLWDRHRDRFAIENHSIVVAPSVTAYAWARNRPAQRPRNDQRRTLILRTADSKGRHGATVANGLRAVYGTDHVEQPSSVTASRFAAAMQESDVVHVEARSVPNEQFPSLSTLVVDDLAGGPQSGMVAQSLAGRSTRAQLVAFERMTVSPVSTGGEGSLGFARELLAAGIPAVVSPVSEIADAAVEEAWLDFYRHYAAGTTAAESLRRAQIEALGESDRRPGPWATLTLFGSSH
jgi:tetratricopeptide (TPR) repeat protein